jgi:hypothetical protein
MRLPAASLRLMTLAIALVVSSGCGGKRLRLGDGAEPSDATMLGGASGHSGAGEGGGGSGGTTEATGGSPEPVGGSAGEAGSGGEGGGACERGRVSAAEVLWIGDSWITIPGLQYERVEELARAAGALGASDEYAVLAEPATRLTDIRDQYQARQAGAIPPRVLIMNGGTWDTIIDNGSDASVASVIDTFEQFLVEVASDGTVEHIVYFLQPELPAILRVASLRPELRRLCGGSTVPCYFIDLQALWLGHPEYTAPDGIQASDAGARAIADAIWVAMVEHCIAQ